MIPFSSKRGGEPMPKRIELPEDKYKRTVLARIEYECNVRGISQEQQRLIAQMSKTTFCKRRKDPGLFRLDDLIRFSKKLKIPVSVLLSEEPI